MRRSTQSVRSETKETSYHEAQENRSFKEKGLGQQLRNPQKGYINSVMSSSARAMTITKNMAQQQREK